MSLGETVAKYLDLDPSLASEFFVVFARFEYSLKRAGFVRVDKKGEAMVDWDCFAKKVSADPESSVLPTTASYLVAHPPKKQVWDDGALAWKDDNYAGDRAAISRLYVLLRRVRNNLFHGNKFYDDQRPDEAHNHALLRSSLDLMCGSLTLKAAIRVREAFFDGNDVEVGS